MFSPEPGGTGVQLAVLDDLEAQGTLDPPLELPEGTQAFVKIRTNVNGYLRETVVRLVDKWGVVWSKTFDRDLEFVGFDEDAVYVRDWPHGLWRLSVDPAAALEPLHEENESRMPILVFDKWEYSDCPYSRTLCRRRLGQTGTEETLYEATVEAGFIDGDSAYFFSEGELLRMPRGARALDRMEGVPRMAAVRVPSIKGVS